MATNKLRRNYRCSDDCEQSGCPSHMAVLTHQSASDAYSFDNGKGQIANFERGELECFISLLKELNEFRMDSIDVNRP
jgi:hypothetical protein